MSLVEITPDDHGVAIGLAYATADNFTGRPVYRAAHCFLHADAAAALRRASALARELGHGLLVLDAYRPPEAQQKLWDHTPDPDYVAPPERGSPHSRGVAVDLTLVDARGRPLDMGTQFDDFTLRAYHDAAGLPAEVRRNRFLLLGLMSTAGWDFYRREWWHYQLFDARRYALVPDAAAPRPMM
ncbi:MAG: D-alanyl-D-alanine dipeptidase [Alphaproteobacteria bacterium]|nr:D-alanyl-D-alanine dipeptidase [Alphaproteobacteria bacterium]